MTQDELKIIIHCSDSEWGHATIINQWHVQRWGHLIKDKNKPAIGYHAVITNGFPTYDHVKKDKIVRIYDGSLEIGRPLDADAELEAHEFGAHAYGFNKETLSICLIGKNTFSKEQIIESVKVVKWWQYVYHIPTKNVLGHCELPGVTKSCPNIDMNTFRQLIHNKAESIRLMRSFGNVIT